MGKSLRTVSKIIVATDTGVWWKDVVDGSMPAGPRYPAYRAIITIDANGVVRPLTGFAPPRVVYRPQTTLVMSVVVRALFCMSVTEMVVAALFSRIVALVSPGGKWRRGHEPSG